MDKKFFNRGPVTQRSMPYWPLLYRGVDPFGGPILSESGSLEATALICKAANQGLIELTSAHDDDLVPWNPNEPYDDADLNGEVRKTISRIRNLLDEANVGFHMVTCNLHSHPMFRRGGLTNPDPRIRQHAKSKVQRTLRIGRMLGAVIYTYWVSRDGEEVECVVSPEVLDWLQKGLNAVTDYITEEGMSNYKMATIEPKPNEPRGHMYLPTAGHAVGFISILDKPYFWQVNPELPQHEGMTGLDPVTCVRYLIKVGKLGFLHFGNQIKGEFDNDFPPLVGPEHLRETVEMFRVMDQMGWSGVVEFDCHALRSELDPDDPQGCRARFIENCSNGLAIALALAERMKRVDDACTVTSESAADHAAILKMCQLSDEEVQPFLASKSK